jgi:hypothetical protein
MPRGSRHIVTGRLRRDGHLWTLDVDGGGTWRLDGAKIGHHVGQRVRVEGVRDDFDLLAVTRIEAI